MVRPNNYTSESNIKPKPPQLLKEIKLSEFTSKPIEDALKDNFDMCNIKIDIDDDNNVRHVTIEYKPIQKSTPF